jgi:hypothetical protein
MNVDGFAFAWARKYPISPFSRERARPLWSAPAAWEFVTALLVGTARPIR